ncbi:phage portal protein, HK97 family [Thermoanaerobacterium aotearoense SCUT27]|uniref:Phage portal protein, HK97 family n=2 Tax=Thermoanaerobacterium TaxID=28895 RepID=W9EA43_9THEO|nr:phage portal protein, HK97 family [Thermoanaerobacterium saccharolyticum JW/SL-YS485]ETO37795.1 phage portal protein, HK97 family [Thermoanaerobacterium aotearoense SCUT27]
MKGGESLQKKQKRSLFSMIFGGHKQEQPTGEYTQLRLLNGWLPVFTPFGQNAYASDTVRAAIDAIARNGAKLTPKHIRRANGQITPIHDNIEDLLRVQPNPYMNAYAFYYKIITQLYLQNNAFVFIDFDNTGNVRGFYPINPIYLDLIEYNGEVYAKFLFLSGDVIVLPYTDLIHLRRFYNDHDFYGQPNDMAIMQTLDVLNTINQGIENAIKSSAMLRGILKFTQAMLKDTDIKAQKDKFVADYMNITNNGGIAALDAKADYIPLDNDPKIINGPQMDLIEQKIYKYYGVSKEIIMSNYNEDQWNAFYESTIEPLAVQMSLEFTNKIFTEREKGFGNEIIFESNRLQYASNTTKTTLIQQLMPLGILTVNEAREILNMAPVEGGDVRLQSLNFVNAMKADDYQGVGGGDNNAGNTVSQNTNQ